MSKLAANTTLVVALVQAILILLVAFDVALTDKQQDAILLVSAAGLAVLGVWFHPSVKVGPTDTP